MWTIGNRVVFSLCLALAIFAAAPALAQQLAPVVTIDGLGKGVTHLDQRWQFHVGDDLRWAQPTIDDAAGQGGWETILPDRPWGAQRHYAYAGFAWYRLHLKITPAAGFNSDFRLLLPSVADVCEVYWNGVLVGRYGTMPPHASWPAVNAPVEFTLAGSSTGTLAIRIWQDRLGSSSPGEIGGLLQAPIIGDEESITNYVGAWSYQFLNGTLYNNALNVLYFLVGIAGVMLWLRRRNDFLLLWFSIFTVCPAIWNSLFTMRVHISSQLGQFLVQPLWQLRNVALWFLLIDMLNLRRHAGLVRWARILAVLSLSAALLDGCLAYIPATWIASTSSAWVDGVLTVIIEPCDLYLLVLAAFGFRQKLDSVRWVLAVTACLSQLIVVTAATAQQGQRFTHWTLAQRLYSPLFHVGPIYLTAQAALDLLLFFTILYAVYRYLQQQEARAAVLEQEMQSARELQEVLIPEKPPDLAGFTISTAYHPALEVGGDFFQVIPLEGESTGSMLIVLGDVSGKGLRAAMAVSLIVGAVRTLAESTSSPARILAGLSRRLHGRLQGGFATCIAMRLDPDGKCTLATAGHPAPYLNDSEIALPGALPLGIDPTSVYDEIVLRIDPGDRCTLYTDGLLEARAESGEIFSFERLNALFAAAADAATASAAAVEFGQEDDITVLTVTRAANA
jgi:serine phosphatase RsbU (regulator of sigma subunit)